MTYGPMRPCPFCGGNNVDLLETSGGVYRAVCHTCGVVGRPSKNKTQALAYWEHRSMVDDAWRKAHGNNKAAAAVNDRMIATVKNQARTEATLRHARAIIDLYDDGGVR